MSLHVTHLLAAIAALLPGAATYVHAVYFYESVRPVALQWLSVIITLAVLVGIVPLQGFIYLYIGGSNQSDNFLQALKFTEYFLALVGFIFGVRQAHRRIKTRS